MSVHLRILYGQEIHSEPFNVCALETAKLFVEKYPSFTCQPASLKFLFIEFRLLTLNTKFPSGVNQPAAEISKLS